MENNNAKNLEMETSNVQEQLTLAMNKLRELAGVNKQLVEQNNVYRVTDFYQRLSWLWTVLKEGKDIVSSELYNNCMEQFEGMLTIENQVKSTTNNDGSDATRE